MILGDFPSDQCEVFKRPFAGAQGQILSDVLHDAGLALTECYLTTVFKQRPTKGNQELLFVKKREADILWKEMGKPGKYPYKACGKAGQYLHPSLLPVLEQLWAEIDSINPNIIVPLGKFAFWALTLDPRQASSRGSVFQLRGYKVITTFHPGFIAKVWNERIVMVADFHKVKREGVTKEFTRRNRSILIEPSLDDLIAFKSYLETQPWFSFDIETKFNMITCIGFGTTDRAICVDFVDTEKVAPSRSIEEEVALWMVVQQIMLIPGVRKVAQNGMYDLTWMYQRYGLKAVGPFEDTMLMHHSMLPEMSKDLGFLSSLYTDEQSWKFLRKSDEKINK